MHRPKASENDDREIAADAKHLGTPAILVLNKADLAGGAPSAEVLSDAESLGLPLVHTDATTERGVDALRTAIIKIVQDDTEPDRQSPAILLMPEIPLYWSPQSIAELPKDV